MPVSSQAVPRESISTDSEPALEVVRIDVGDLELATSRGCQRLGHIDHVGVVEVEPGDGEVRLGLRRLLLDVGRLSLGVEADDAVGGGIAHVVAEDRGPVEALDRRLELLADPFAVEDVVAQDQADPIAGDELLADQERLGDAPGLGLLGVAQASRPTGCRRREPPRTPVDRAAS